MDEELAETHVGGDRWSQGQGCRRYKLAVGQGPTDGPYLGSPAQPPFPHPHSGVLSEDRLILSASARAG